MKGKKVLGLAVLALSLSVCGAGQCEEKTSFADTARRIKQNMSGATSEARKETYGKIEFADCLLSYDVWGTYPVGDPYHIKFSGIDFSGLNPRESRVGHDYTSFISLSFENPLRYQTEGNEIEVRTLVINVSDDGRAASLFRDLLQLGELCRAAKKP